MNKRVTMEGTWEDIKLRESELTGQQVRVIIKDKSASNHQVVGNSSARTTQNISESGRVDNLLRLPDSKRHALPKKKFCSATSSEQVNNTGQEAKKHSSALGKYPLMAGVAEEFAKEKLAEIERDDREF